MANRHLVGMILTVLLSTPALADTLTAVCSEPKGRATGWRGDTLKRVPFDNADGFKGGHVTIIWETTSPRARILTKADAQGPTLSEYAAEVYQSKEQVTFTVQYPPIGVYMYSLFSGPKKLLVSGHTVALLESNGATMKSFSGNCEITVK